MSILVNNAGGVFASPILETTENGWDALYRANLRHVLLCTQRVARGMVAAGIGGSITTSPPSRAYGRPRATPPTPRPRPASSTTPRPRRSSLRLTAYGSTRSAPDITLTEGIAAIAPPGSEARFGNTVPMGRAGHVDEMAGAAVFLASDMASYITGQTIHVDGGTHAAGGWYHHPETGEYSLGPTD